MNKSHVVFAIFLLTCVTAQALAANPEVARFKIIDNKYPPLCTAIVQILNDKENASYSINSPEMSASANTEFKIPQNFTSQLIRPQWEDVKLEELDTSGLYLPHNVVSKIKNDYSKNGSYKVQKTTEPFDFNNESQETGINPLYRYQLGKKNNLYCVIPEQPSYQNKFNTSSLTFGCSALSYKNVNFILYIIKQNEESLINIDTVNAYFSKKQKSVNDYMELGYHHECSFSEQKLMKGKSND